jgi:UDP-4-amino-4,6-dideoxy-N-acetyl-beta-L-altrosamine N-acetyltransferase
MTSINSSPNRPWNDLVLGPVRLRPLEYQDIEKVRNWRNDPEVAQFMVFRGIITKEQQEAWFRRIQNERSFYAIIVVNDADIGLADLKNFSEDARSAEGGIFIHAKSFQNSIYGYAVSVLLLDFAFLTLDLEMVKAKIVNDNLRAIRFNESVGYIRDDQDAMPGVGTYCLTADRYHKKIAIIRRALMTSFGVNS